MSNESVRARQPWWLNLLWAIGGLVCDWRSAYLTFFRRYPPFITTVLRTSALIAVICAVGALLAIRVIQRAKLRDAGAVFCLFSSEVLFEVIPPFLRSLSIREFALVVDRVVSHC